MSRTAKAASKSACERACAASHRALLGRPPIEFLSWPSGSGNSAKTPNLQIPCCRFQWGFSCHYALCISKQGPAADDGGPCSPLFGVCGATSDWRKGAESILSKGSGISFRLTSSTNKVDLWMKKSNVAVIAVRSWLHWH